MHFEHIFPVEWVDTDALGIVHFSNYFRYFEKAECELLRKIGLSYDYIFSQGIAAPRVEAFCKYLKPLRFGDIVKVSLNISEIGNKHLKYNFEIFAENRKEKVAEGYVVIVTIDMKTFKAVNIPPFIIEKLQKLA
jgi:acyl-CoA thioester hydrolase